MIRYFLLLVTMISLAGCAFIKSETGLYKLSGSTSKHETHGEPWVQITYHGGENETIKEGVTSWHDAVKGECQNTSYDVKDVSFFHQFLTPGSADYDDDIMIYYPEDDNKKWPQVVALYRC